MSKKPKYSMYNQMWLLTWYALLVVPQRRRVCYSVTTVVKVSIALALGSYSWSLKVPSSVKIANNMCIRTKPR